MLFIMAMAPTAMGITTIGFKSHFSLMVEVVVLFPSGPILLYLFFCEGFIVTAIGKVTIWATADAVRVPVVLELRLPPPMH